MGNRRSKAVTLGVTALLASSLAACGSSEPKATGSAVCVDQNQVRVPDNNCANNQDFGANNNGFLWYYLLLGQHYGGYGSRVTGGYTTRPPGKSFNPVRGGNPQGGSVSKGATVSRGGFGGSHGSGHGGG